MAKGLPPHAGEKAGEKSRETRFIELACCLRIGRKTVTTIRAMN